MNWHELFEYKEGKLYRKARLSNNCDISLPAGKLHKATGYCRVNVGQKKYREHRIIWEMFNGPIPEGKEIDHINHIRSDNRIENLRLVDRLNNTRNTSLRDLNTSGRVGVSWDSRANKWRVNITVKGKCMNLGRFIDFDEAVSVREAAENQYGFHENHGR